MTAVEIRFRYQAPFQPQALPRTSEDHGFFGIRKMRLDQQQNVITVEYDATRLDPKGVESVLRRVGVPIVERI